MPHYNIGDTIAVETTTGNITLEQITGGRYKDGQWEYRTRNAGYVTDKEINRVKKLLHGKK